MPEFQLNGKTAEFSALPPIVRGYIEAAFFTADEDIGEEKGFLDITSEDLNRIIAECAAFAEANREDIAILIEDGGQADGYDEESAGRDLWYTRNGHGVGFWDRGFRGEAGAAAERLSDAAVALGESDAYLSDRDEVCFTP